MSTATGPRSCPTVVGRESELAAAMTALAERSSLVLIEGEPGVGKSRLVREVLGDPSLLHHRRLVGHSQPLRDPLPLAPVVDALRHLTAADLAGVKPVAGALRPLLPELIAWLPEQPDDIADSLSMRHRVYRAIAAVLENCAPAVLVLEDLQWADTASLDFLAYFVPAIPDGVHMVLTYRGMERRSPGFFSQVATRAASGTEVLHLELSPLDAEGVHTLVSKMLDAPVSHSFARYLHERTGGIPFAIEEVLRLLHGRRDLIHHQGRWLRLSLGDLDVPVAVRETVLERVQALSSDAKHVLECAAVLDAVVEQPLLMQTAQLPSEVFTAALTEAIERALLIEPKTQSYCFRHSLARQAVHDAIPGPRRRQLHERAAEMLQALHPDASARLAHHHREAGATDAWLEYAERTADLAREHGHDDAAAWYLKEALRTQPGSKENRVRLALKLGAAALSLQDADEAIALIRDVLTDAELPRAVRGELRLWVAFLLSWADDSSSSYEEMRASIEDLEERPDLLARALSMLALPWAPEGTEREHLEFGRRARAIAAAGEDVSTRAGVLVNELTARLAYGDPSALDEAELLRADSPDAQRQVLRGHVNFADVLLMLGHYDRAARHVDAAAALVQELDYERLSPNIEAARQTLWWLTGRWDGLEERARGLTSAGLDALVGVDVHVVLGQLHLTRGVVGNGIELLEYAAARAEAAGTYPAVATCAGALARHYVARGEAAQATRWIESALSIIRAKDAWVWAAELAPTAVALMLMLRRLADAEQFLSELTRGTSGRASLAAPPAISMCRAQIEREVGTAERAVSYFDEAAAAWNRLPRPLEAARAAEEAGTLLLPQGSTDAIVRLKGALQSFSQLGAIHDATRVELLLRRHGALAKHRTGRRGYGEQLSPREEEVVELASLGLTNSQIASKLFLSRTTVANHVQSALRKLGLRSKRDLLMRRAGAAQD